MNGTDVHIPVSTPDRRQAASNEATAPSLSLPIQDALRRFNTGIFADAEGYGRWLQDNDPAEQTERLYDHE